MKSRINFVSNSSTSSFTVNIKDLTGEEIIKLLDYPPTNDTIYDTWDLWEQGNKIYGFTTMDNGHLKKYLGGILNSKLKYGS